MERRGLVIGGLWAFVGMAAAAMIGSSAISTPPWHDMLLMGGGGLGAGCFLGLLAILLLLPRDTKETHEAGRDHQQQRDGAIVSGNNNTVNVGAGRAAPGPANHQALPLRSFMPANPPGDMPLCVAIHHVMGGKYEPTGATEEEAFRQIKDHAYSPPGGPQPKLSAYGRAHSADAPRAAISSNNWRDAKPMRTDQGITGLEIGGALFHDVYLENDEFRRVWPLPTF